MVELCTKVTPFQEKLMQTISSGPNGMRSITEIAGRMKTSRLAVHRAIESLRNKGMAGSFRNGHDQWALLYGYLKEPGKVYLKMMKESAAPSGSVEEVK